MVVQSLTIARNTFIESVRQPIFFVLIALAGLLQLLNTSITAYSMGYTESTEVSGDDKLLLDVGLATVFVVGMILAALTATNVMSREIEEKTVLTIVSKPIARPAIVVGKFLGVGGAISVAVGTMLIFLLMAVRHGVMSTASDVLDQPVLLFTGLALLIAVGVGVWGNFFYGWSFPQTAVLLLFPLMLAAYVLVLLFSKKWAVQPLGTDFKPQILTACLALAMAILVLSAAATAASTRLGQVMTIVVCAGLFGLGLLSNHLLGRRAIENVVLGEIKTATPARDEDAGWATPGATYTIELVAPPERAVAPGDAFYYGPSPNGLALAITPYPVFEGDPADPDDLEDRTRPGGLVVTSSAGPVLTVTRAGGAGLSASRGPRTGDFVFPGPTRLHAPALVAWSVVPNMHFFWLLDSVTQNRPVPIAHVGMILAYGLAQCGIFLCAAVALFQTRDVG